MNKRIYLFLLGLGFVVSQASAQEIPLKEKKLFGDLKARQIGPALMSGRISDIEVHPTNNKIVYIGTAGGGVWKSGNAGTSFTSIFDDHAQSIGAVAIDPSSPDRIVWVGTGEVWTRNSVSVGDGIYRSNDGGINWKKMGLEKSERISSIEINPNNSDEVFVGVLGALYGDNEERGVYKTSDGGKTFKNLGNMHADIHDIAYDIKDSDKLLVATDGGLYRTWDGGTTMEIVANLPVSQFYHVSVDNKSPYNVYGGLQDNGSLYGPSVSPGGIEARDWNSVGAGDGFRVYKHPTKDIVYSEMQGAENVWRYDIQRNQTKSIQPLAVKGINVVTWNGMVKQPKIAKGKTFSYGGFTSPRVQAGKYKVVMTKGKQKYETIIELINDPKSLLTEQERKEQYETTMSLYNLSQELAYMVYELDAHLEKAEELVKSDKKAKKSTEPVAKKLNALKETLVITTGDNYVGQAKNQLREDLSELYSKIASGFAAPSAAEKDNLSLIVERYAKAKADFDKIKSKEIKKMQSYLTEKQLEQVKIKTYDAFIND